MKRIGLIMTCALMALLAARASADPVSAPRLELGHVLVLTDQAQVYVKTGVRYTVFSALLPGGWSLGILVDGDKNGVWGKGRFHNERRFNSRSDFLYGAAADNRPCSAYIYDSYAEDPDMVYATSPCGVRKSAATLTVAPDSGSSLQTLTIPNRELGKARAAVHFAIKIWDGSGLLLFRVRFNTIRTDAARVVRGSLRG